MVSHGAQHVRSQEGGAAMWKNDDDSNVGRSKAQANERYNQHTHPREWAIWKKVDKNRDGEVTMQEVRQMCRKFDATAHADVLCGILDPGEIGKVTFEYFCKNFPAVHMVRNTARLKMWNRTFGLGVAGNVAGHMAQAGEAEAGASAAQKTPAAVFTWYAPHPYTVDATEKEVVGRLQRFPVTNAVIELPHSLEGAGKVQVEPEIALYVDVVYSKDGNSVERLVPRRLAAFNDCSIRELEGSDKLSQKKNWGFGSKGISLRSFRVHSMSKGTLVDKLALTSYVKRGSTIHQYSVNAAARNYLMFHDELLEWIIEQINTQKNTGKWEEIFPELVRSDYPTSMWIALGAGEYTEWGATNYLQRSDETLVALYNEDEHPNGLHDELVRDLFRGGPSRSGVLALHQVFV